MCWAAKNIVKAECGTKPGSITAHIITGKSLTSMLRQRLLWWCFIPPSSVEVTLILFFTIVMSCLYITSNDNDEISDTMVHLCSQPGKLTEAFKYFLQGMGYSKCSSARWHWVMACWVFGGWQSLAYGAFGGWWSPEGGYFKMFLWSFEDSPISLCLLSLYLHRTLHVSLISFLCLSPSSYFFLAPCSVSSSVLILTSLHVGL